MPESTFHRSARRHMRGVRPPAVAGSFYPDDGSSLRRLVDELLAGAEPAFSAPSPQAVIAPHAGYAYSGPVAASAFASLRRIAGQIERVMLIGPSHWLAFRGVALPAAEALATPLGKVEIDLTACEDLLELPHVQVAAEPHAREHALEVELPFLQRLLGSFQLVPLVVGQATAPELQQIYARLWDAPATLVVVSSDLSHFLDDATARRVDAATARAICDLRAELQPRQACGALAINGLLLAARARAMRVAAVDVRNSSQAAGDPRRVVGYGAFVLSPGGGA